MRGDPYGASRHQPERRRIKGKHMVALAVVGLLVFMLWPAKEPAAAGAIAPDKCDLADPVKTIGRLVGNVEACLSELTGGATGATGTGRSAYLTFDNAKWSVAMEPINDVTVKENEARIVSYGTTSVMFRLLNEKGDSVYAYEGTRGEYASAKISWLTGQNVRTIEIQDSGIGIQKIAVKG